MKKQLLKSALIAVAGVGLLAGSAMATYVNPVSPDGVDKSLNKIFESYDWNIDANTDQITEDKYWSVAEKASGSWASLLIEVAGNFASNTFGIYDTNGNVQELMGGTSGAGDKVAIEWNQSGLLGVTLKDYNPVTGLTTTIIVAENIEMSRTFGFYIGNINGPLFYSDYTKNAGNSDQMVSYVGTDINGLSIGHYIIAFEDVLYGNSDKDFNDMVLMVESVKPIPEPTTMLLFGTGLLSLAAAARRRKNS